MSWIQTFSGKQFWLLDPRAGDVCIEDISHALAHTCRFNGHCREFYSVAEHSVHVVNEVKKRAIYRESGASNRKQIARLALLHDAAEAYIGDMVRPLKNHMPEFRRVEILIADAIRIAFGVPFCSMAWNVVKHCDNVMLATEARDLLGETPAEWDTLPPPRDETLAPLGPYEAELLFMEEWNATA